MGLDKGIWVDEWSSISVSQSGGLLETLAKLRYYDHPPLYYMMLHLWSQLGNNEVFLRLPSVVMGIGTMVVAMVWLRLYSNLASILIGLLLGAAPMFLRYSQEIRDYPLLLLATALAFLFASLVQKKPERLSNYVGLGLSLAVGIASHLAAIFLILPVCVFLYALPSRGKTLHWSKIIPTLAIPTGVFLFLYLFFLLNLDKSSDWWVPSISASTIALTASSLFGLSMFPWPWVLERVLFVAVPFFAVGLAFGDWRSSAPFLMAALVYWVQIIIYSVAITPIFLDRVLLPGLIPLAAFVALQIASTKQKVLRTISIVTCISLGLASGLNWAIQRAWEPVEPWKQVSSLLDSQLQKNSLLVFYPDYCAGPVEYYSTRLQSVKALEIRPRTGEKDLAKRVSSSVGSLNENSLKPQVFLVVRYDSDTSNDSKTLLGLLSGLKEQISGKFTITVLSFGIEPSESSSRAIASILGLPSHFEAVGSFMCARYEL
jgi:4-amino-4-deoxy-L-arabinose transferase-like glycosyltransferase